MNIPEGDYDGLLRMCHGQIPEAVEQFYFRVKKVWDRASGGGPLDAPVLALIVTLANVDEEIDAEFIPKKGRAKAKELAAV